MARERDLYLGEQTEYTTACVRATYNFCFQKLEQLGIKPGSLGLDIGSNQGYGLTAESASNYQVVASDCFLKYASLAKKNSTTGPVLVLNARNLPFREDSFDFIMMHQVIEHLEESEQPLVISEIIKALKPEGVAFISTPNANSRPRKSRPYSPDHKHEMELEEFFGLLQRHFGKIDLYGQRFISKRSTGQLYQLARSSFLGDIYFHYLPRSLRLKFRDWLNKHQQADIIKPLDNTVDGIVPRSLLAVCCYPKK